MTRVRLVKLPDLGANNRKLQDYLTYYVRKFGSHWFTALDLVIWLDIVNKSKSISTTTAAHLLRMNMKRLSLERIYRGKDKRLFCYRLKCKDNVNDTI